MRQVSYIFTRCEVGNLIHSFFNSVWLLFFVDYTFVIVIEIILKKLSSELILYLLIIIYQSNPWNIKPMYCFVAY